MAYLATSALAAHSEDAVHAHHADQAARSPAAAAALAGGGGWRVARLLESLAQLTAAGLLPAPGGAPARTPSPGASECGESVASVSPSDSASCAHLRAGARSGVPLGGQHAHPLHAHLHAGKRRGGADGGGQQDGDEADRALARHVRRVQLIARKAARASSGAPAPPALPAGAGGARASLPGPPGAAGRTCAGVPHQHAGAGRLPCTPAAPAALPPAASAAAAAVAAAGGGCRGCFVGNLAAGVTEHALMALFSRAGPIHKLWVVKDPRTQLSLGYAYVVFGGPPLAAAAAAAAAEAALDGAELCRRRLSVRASARDFGGAGPRGGSPPRGAGAPLCV